jgi:DNA-binding CsgD family transcriptional regulator/tetratricopeptide (TPR) repeat protein
VVLLGRGPECAALDGLLGAVRAGQSGALVVRGEPGVGKTALLDYVVEQAAGFRVLRAAGVESEMELAFAALHQLSSELLDRRDALPEPQRDALAVAFGLKSGTPPDRLFVGLAVLGLLSETAAERPLVCVVDDAQWLDRESAHALAFTARRLGAESVAVIVAVREPAEDETLAALPELRVEGLADPHAQVLLASALHGPMDERVRDRIVAEMHGNPLALLELPRGMTPAELAGGFALSEAMPLAGRIEAGFVRQLESLPADTRRLLLAAAVEPVGDVTLLWRAAERLGLGPEAATAAEAAGLIEIGARVRFRHPLVRSAVAREADAGELREVHRALAEATDPDIDPDRRAWHRAHAAVGPDEAVADELESSAARAHARGGLAAAAAFLERAAELTPDPARRGGRAPAASAKVDVGAPDAARELLAAAELAPLNGLQQARLDRMRAACAFIWGRRSDALPLVLAAARRFEPLDVPRARETYVGALGAAIFSGRLSGDREMEEAVTAARTAPPAPRPPRPIDLLLDGLTIRFTDGYAASVPALKHALTAFVGDRQRSPDEGRQWLWVGWPVANEIWDDEAWHALTAWAVRVAREAGELTLLPIALHYRAGVHVFAGELAAASGVLEEATAINRTLGLIPLVYVAPVLAAWLGDETRATEQFASAVAEATTRGGEARVITLTEYARALLYNGLGRYEDALAAAQRACQREDLGLFGWSLAELVEAAARCGKPDLAAEALRRLEERTGPAGTDWALGVQAAARAQLSDDAEGLYREALERLGGGRLVVLRTRAELLYGEWLRREGRRVDARVQLRAAYERFSDMGAEGFAERARRELAATGETARKRSVETRDELTAQEGQIARLAADGLTNVEIGAQLFISHRTVEWHLKKVFAKLDIKSRKQISEALSAGGRAA